MNDPGAWSDPDVVSVVWAESLSFGLARRSEVETVNKRQIEFAVDSPPAHLNDYTTPGRLKPLENG